MINLQTKITTLFSMRLILWDDSWPGLSNGLTLLTLHLNFALRDGRVSAHRFNPLSPLARLPVKAGRIR